MMKHISLLRRTPTILTLLLFGLLASACAPSAMSQLDDAEKKWQSAAVESYAIEVLEVNSIWHAQTQTLTVVDGQVTDTAASCIPAPMEMRECKVKAFEAQRFTIDGLFAEARSRLKSEQAKWVKISYDPTYGYPATISYNHPDIVDEDWGMRVTKFEVQK